MKNGAVDTANICINEPAMNIKISFFKFITPYMFLAKVIIMSANHPVINHWPAESALWMSNFVILSSINPITIDKHNVNVNTNVNFHFVVWRFSLAAFLLSSLFLSSIIRYLQYDIYSSSSYLFDIINIKQSIRKRHKKKLYPKI